MPSFDHAGGRGIRRFRAGLPSIQCDISACRGGVIHKPRDSLVKIRDALSPHRGAVAVPSLWRMPTTPTGPFDRVRCQNSAKPNAAVFAAFFGGFERAHRASRIGRKMNAVPFRFCVLAVAGWIHRGQQHVMEYLVAENRVLRKQFGGRRLVVRTRTIRFPGHRGYRHPGHSAPLVSDAGGREVRRLATSRPLFLSDRRH
jgi:hypothetical protein